MVTPFRPPVSPSLAHREGGRRPPSSPLGATGWLLGGALRSHWLPPSLFAFRPCRFTAPHRTTTMLQKQRSSPYVRTTMQLTGTVRHADLRLSFQAVASAQLTVQMLARASSPRPTLSAVARRALLDYAKRVEAMTQDERAREARRVSDASRGMPPDREEVERVKASLEAAAEGAPLPTLAEVTCAPPLDLDELELRVNRTLKAMHPRKFKDLPTE